MIHLSLFSASYLPNSLITGVLCPTIKKEIVDIGIGIYQSTETVIVGTVTVTPETAVITIMELLLKLTESEEEGGLGTD